MVEKKIVTCDKALGDIGVPVAPGLAAFQDWC